jgi:hypothetical protein
MRKTKPKISRKRIAETTRTRLKHLKERADTLRLSIFNEDSIDDVLCELIDKVCLDIGICNSYLLKKQALDKPKQNKPIF